MIKAITLLIFFQLLITSSYAKEPSGVDETQDVNQILQEKKNSKRVQESLKNNKINERKNMAPDGVFYAPAIFAQIKRVRSSFLKTSLIDIIPEINVTLGSTQEINAWVSSAQDVTEIKTFNMVVTKGLIDIVSDKAYMEKYFKLADGSPDKEYIDHIYRRSEGILAFIFGHELGHAMSGHTEDVSVTVRMYNELEADMFAVKLLAEAGYAPEAAIDALDLLGRLHENPSLRQLIATMLDEHPKSRFRVANIAEEVLHLQEQHRAKQAFGFAAESQSKKPQRPVNRTGREHASKNSVTALNKKLQADSFTQMELRDQLVYLNEYLNISSVKSDGMSKQSIVRIVNEYKSLLAKAKSHAEVELLNDFLFRFEADRGALARASGENKGSNAKSAFRELKRAITEKHIELFKADGTEMRLGNLDQWFKHIDYRDVLGEFIKKARNAQTPQELEEILKFKTDSERISFMNKYKHQNSKLHSELNDIGKLTIERAVLRHLYLTNNVAETFDFMQRTLIASQSNIFGYDYALAAILRYISDNENVEFGNINERLSNPKVAIDNFYGKMMQERGHKAGTLLQSRRGYGISQNPLSASFSYGIGRKYKAAGLSKEHVKFLTRALYQGTEVGNYVIHTIVNDVIGNITASKNRVVEKIIETLSGFAELDQFKLTDGNGTKLRRRITIPRINFKKLNSLSIAERMEVFSYLAFHSFIKPIRRLNNSEDRFNKSIEELEEVLEDLVKTETVTADLKKEFLKNIRQFKKLLDTDIDYENQKVGTELIKLRGLLKEQYFVLSTSYVDLGDKLSERSHSTMTKMFDMGNELKSTMDLLLTNFWTLDSQEARDQLSKINNGKFNADIFAEEHRYSEIIAFYNGQYDYKNLNGLSKPIIAKYILAPNVKPVQIGSTSYAHFPNSKQIYNEDHNKKEISSEFDKLILTHRLRDRNHDLDFSDSVYFVRYQAAQPKIVADLLRSKDPIESLLGALTYIESHENKGAEEAVTRTYFLLLARSLSLVENKQQMDRFAGLIASYLKTRSFGASLITSLLSGDVDKIANLSNLRYREVFIDQLIFKINKYNSWTGEEKLARTAVIKFFERRALAFEGFLAHLKGGKQFKNNNSYLGKKLWIFDHVVNANYWLLMKYEWYRKQYLLASNGLSKFYTRTILQRSAHPIGVKKKELLVTLRSHAVWSEPLDIELAQYIKKGQFEEWFVFNSSKRERAVELLKEIRSLPIRDRIYQYIIAEYGRPTDSIINKTKSYWNLYKLKKSAAEVWTEETLDELRNASTDLDRYRIVTEAWESHAKKLAQEKGITEDDAGKRLLNLYNAYQKTLSPFIGEVNSVFPENNRFKDKYLEDFANREGLNYEQLRNIENNKSYKSESPLHKISKALFELIDEHISRLKPLEQAKLALYLSSVSSNIEPGIAEAFKKIVYGGRNRTQALKHRGYYFSLKDMGKVFEQSHPDEKMMAFRAMFLSGLSKDKEAEDFLIENLLFADKKMPSYLRKVLNIYLQTISSNERAIIISWMLANGSNGPLKGPQIVKLMIEKGGVAAAKLAQLIASHGFRLDKEYQEVLEVFKAKAQRIDKIVAMELIKKRLPKEKYDQIKTLDRLYGAGSLKIAYGATLNNGKKVIIMIARDHIYSKTLREFELLRKVIDEVMKDPALRIESLPTLSNEVERIIVEEMNFKNEAELMKKHKEALQARPLLVRLVGNIVRVKIPQPLEGWVADGVLVEEFVESKKFSDLPNSRFLGWTKAKLAKASINEIVNQLLLYMIPNEQKTGKVIIDIDPHEENQLAKSFLGIRTALVNIDLGQSVEVDPEDVRGLVRIVGNIYLNRVDDAVEFSKEFVNFKDAKQIKIYKEELIRAMKLYSDPIEVITAALEESQLKGISLKEEFLYFQKLFATMVGLKKHVVKTGFIYDGLIKLFKVAFGEKSKFAKKVIARIRLQKQRSLHNSNYLTRQIQKAVAIRAITNPIPVTRELTNLYKTRGTKGSQAISCKLLFAR